jgi:hypothetical protein
VGELIERGVGIEQFKQELVAAIKHKAKWRSERAGQYRSDRNARSAAALEALARALDGMPTNHPRILRVWALKQRHCGPEPVFAEQELGDSILAFSSPCQSRIHRLHPATKLERAEDSNVYYNLLLSRLLPSRQDDTLKWLVAAESSHELGSDNVFDIHIRPHEEGSIMDRVVSEF